MSPQFLQRSVYFCPSVPSCPVSHKPLMLATRVVFHLWVHFIGTAQTPKIKSLINRSISASSDMKASFLICVAKRKRAPNHAARRHACCEGLLQ